jgi:CRP-like cAMP-binding protein
MDTPNHYLSRYREIFGKLVEFTDEEWQIFSQGLRLEKLKKKAHFAEAGQVSRTVGLIVSGSMRCYNVKDGEEITTYFCLEDEWVSSYKSFLTQQPSIIYIDALEDTCVLTFTYQYLQQCYAHPKLAYKMERFGRLIAEHIICCYEDRVVAFVSQTPEERYLRLLETNKNILQRIPQHYIANYLGITPVSLSRIRKRIMVPA